MCNYSARLARQQPIDHFLSTFTVVVAPCRRISSSSSSRSTTTTTTTTTSASSLSRVRVSLCVARCARYAFICVSHAPTDGMCACGRHLQQQSVTIACSHGLESDSRLAAEGLAKIVPAGDVHDAVSTRWVRCLEPRRARSLSDRFHRRRHRRRVRARVFVASRARTRPPSAVRRGPRIQAWGGRAVGSARPGSSASERG